MTTTSERDLPLYPFIITLFTGTVCSSMIGPYMAFYIVEGLGRSPSAISLYAGMVTVLGIFCTRTFGRWLDAGKAPFPLIGVALAGYVLATSALSLAPTFEVLLTFGVLGFGLSSSAVATMFSLGRVVAERRKIALGRSNALMRTTTSTAWMMGPAIAFLVSERFGEASVFKLALGLALCWAVMWWKIIPRGLTLNPKNGSADRQVAQRPVGLWLAAAFIFCLSSAHSLTFSALPLFYVREVGLPGYAPGTAFSMKTFFEVIAIFSTPWIISRFGLRGPLFAVALLAAATIQLLSHIHSYPQMLAGAALEGLYYGLYASLGISFIQSFAGDRPAQATALYWNVLSVSGILAGPAVGLIAQAYDFRTVIQISSIVATFAALIMMASMRRRGRA
ncbi:MFS transporter [Agrobacterium vaccinii]|uniref:MFS transporter n=1 Tax=Agrobacterium vaccinii TaxID=2735528 RepID=UPI001E540C0E|nr:MFS transporter [Agrobacterium vaccinii]UHS61711.1 MFS transporter [Agrobacterium vaccinii]